MALRTILKKDTDEESLRKKSRPVTVFDQRLHNMIDDMVDTLKDSGGVGLAAPQVGILRSVCVVDVGEGPIELVNPEIIATEGEQNGAEGCLSYPGEYGLVKRPMKVTVRAQDRDGNWFEKTGEALCARAFCHEIDHLHGVLFTSHVSRMLTPEELENGVIEEEE